MTLGLNYPYVFTSSDVFLYDEFQASVAPGLRRSRISFPGLKAGMTLSDTCTAAPVGVATDASWPNLDGERTKISQFYSVAASHRSNDFIQNSVDDLLNVAVIEVGALSCNSQRKL